MEATHVTLKELKNNYSKYFNTTVVISDCPFYINASNIHTYVINISKKGGATIILDNGSKYSIPSANIVQADATEGVVVRTGTYGYTTQLVLPTGKFIAQRIQTVLATSTKALANYKNLYEGKRKTVNNIKEVLKNHPEYLI